MNECRTDGRCQYAIDHDMEGVGHCPEGQCCMTADGRQFCHLCGGIGGHNEGCSAPIEDAQP